MFFVTLYGRVCFCVMKKEDDNIVVNGLANTSQVTISVQFADVEGMIRTAKRRAYSAVNTELIDLYWHIGAYISQRVENAT